MKIKDFIEELKKLDQEGELVDLSYWQDMGARIPNISKTPKVEKQQDGTYKIVWKDYDYHQKYEQYK